jgi:tRNA nucleotidyltransferase/poly(A) polymerase
MDEHTARLARGCIEMGLVGDLSSARLRDELIALLEEGEVGHSVLRLAELGAAGAIHPHLAADDEAVELLRRGRALTERYRLDVPAWRIGLAVLARRMPPAEIYPWLQRLRVRRRDVEAIAAAVTVGPRLAARLAAEGAPPSEVVSLVERHAPDAPLFALALSDVAALHRYFSELQGVRLEVTGADLAELGLPESPQVGEVLAELRRRKLNGELDGRESELAAARALIAGSA